MIRNYLITTIRNLTRQKLYSSLNIIGLAIGLAAFTFIFIWINDEKSYDQFHSKKDRIYRIASHVITPSEEFTQAVTSAVMGPELELTFPEVLNSVRFDYNDAIVKRDDVSFLEENILLTDPSFFKVFDFRLLQGDVEKALSEPYQIVLSESMARKYFGKENPLNKTIRLNLYDPEGNGVDYLVTGVIENCPTNVHFTYDMLASFSTYTQLEGVRLDGIYGWSNNGFYTYIEVDENTDVGNLRSKIAGFVDEKVNSQLTDFNLRFEFILQPLKDIYLNSDLRYEFGRTGNAQSLKLFGTIGIFILILAGINYVNLATALASKRATDVGVRKVIGARKSQLIGQYLTESAIIALIAGIFALVIMFLTQEWFYKLTWKPYLSILNLKVILSVLGNSLILGLISGVLPSFVLSKAPSGVSLKGYWKSGSGGVTLRRGLIIFQFSIALILVVGVWVVNSQMDFIESKDLGYNKDNLIYLRVNGNEEVKEHFESFKKEVLGSCNFSSMARSRTSIIGGLSNSWVKTVNNTGEMVESSMYRIRSDEEFISTYEMKLIAGRNFSDLSNKDSAAFIVNEAAVKTLGWDTPESAIGKPFEQYEIQGEVIGVVENFHYNSLAQPIDAVALHKDLSNFSGITVRYRNVDFGNAIDGLEEIWKTHFPNSIFDARYLQHSLEEQYRSEKQFDLLFRSFTMVCLVIACVGLFGLVTFSSQQRLKEISIRKILGSSLTGIVWLLTRDFMKMVVASFLVAFPVAWVLMKDWLDGFVFKVSLNAWVFIGSGLSVLLIALFTSGFQSLRAALANPVKSLRSE
ncbi:MAG: ABC transporter permease [Bacteroidota bacterium]